MTLQQLRYLIAIAAKRSISAAAHELFVSQSSLSVAVKEVEQECGIKIFERSSKGITLTNEGMEFLGYARQVIEQADLMQARYSQDSSIEAPHLAVSSQHYAFPVEAFLAFVDEYEGEGYNFTLRETRTSEIIKDVSEFKSDIGILYLSSFNRRVMLKAFEDANVKFEELFSAAPHIFIGENHPLANKASIKLEELEDYPRYTFEQGSVNSFFYAEEPFAELPHEKRVIISDRGTLSNLLAHHNGFTVATGVLSSEMHSGIVSIPLETDEVMVVGYIVHNERKISLLAQKYIERLRSLIANSYF